MKTPLLIAVLVLAPLFQGCSDFVFVRIGGKSIAGSGTIATETRTVSDFDRVSVSGSGELTLIQGEEESLTITADDNFLHLIQSEVNGGYLRIGPRNVSLRPTEPIQYTLKLKTITALNLSGSLRANAGKIATEDFEAGISGSGKIRIGHLDAGSVSIGISGSGDAELAGSVNRQKLRVSGSGGYEAADLESAIAEVSISGSGDATLSVSEELNARISGSGSVRYYGRPRVTQSVSGSGKIRRLGEK